VRDPDKSTFSDHPGQDNGRNLQSRKITGTDHAPYMRKANYSIIACFHTIQYVAFCWYLSTFTDVSQQRQVSSSLSTNFLDVEYYSFFHHRKLMDRSPQPVERANRNFSILNTIRTKLQLMRTQFFLESRNDPLRYVQLEVSTCTLLRLQHTP